MLTGNRLSVQPPITRRNVAIIVDQVGAYGRQILRGVAAYVQTHSHWSVRDEASQALAERLRIGDLDGVIAQSASPDIQELLKGITVPAVNVSGRYRESPVPRVASDDEATGRMVAAYFTERGFKHFAFAGFPGVYFSWGRGEAFAAALRAMGHDCRMIGHTLDTQAETVSQRDLIALSHPCAIMATDDYAARRVVREALSAGLRVPEDIAVVGVENDPLLCDLAPVPLSSVQSGALKIGYEACRLLETLMDGARAPKRPLLITPIGVVTRRSSDMLSLDDAEVAAALRFIRDRATAALRVTDVVHHIGLSRRMLEIRFRRATKRSIRGEIERARLERAVTMLASSQLPIGRIATSVGFSEPRHLSIVFRRVLGTTPSAYRQRFRVH